jgi:uncharacterized membrane protein YfcA
MRLISPLARRRRARVSTMKLKPLTIVSATLLLVLLATTPAQAYVDPGSASILVQVVIGTVLGAVVAARLYWQKIKAFFRRGRDDDPAP